jgi:hypothetical protein
VQECNNGIETSIGEQHLAADRMGGVGVSVQESLRLGITIKRREYVVASKCHSKRDAAASEELGIARNVRRHPCCCARSHGSQTPQPGEDLICNHRDATRLAHLKQAATPLSSTAAQLACVPEAHVYAARQRNV